MHAARSAAIDVIVAVDLHAVGRPAALASGVVARIRAEHVAGNSLGVIARGLNLMGRMNRAEEAAALFAKEIALAPDGPGTDALLLGLVNARLAQNRRADAEAAEKQMEQRFAGSPYTARAKQLVAAAKK